MLSLPTYHVEKSLIKFIKLVKLFHTYQKPLDYMCMSISADLDAELYVYK
jgi:hypothetical protein